LGSYEFIVTADVGGLCENYDTVLITVTDDFSVVAFGAPDTICAGEQVSLTATPSGGTGVFVYEWSSIPSGFSGNQASTTDNPALPIQYIIVVTSGGCVHSDTVPVMVRQQPSSNFSIDTPLCVGEVTNASVLGNVIATNNYDWNFGNGLIQSGNGSGPYQVLWDVPGTWPVDLTVTDQYGCSSKTIIDVEVNPNPIASFIANYSGCQPLITAIENTSTGASTYLWDFGDGTSSTDTVSTHSYSSAGTYTITLIATNKGCSSSSSAIVTSYCDQVFFPGAFSPNDDGSNDFFHEIGALQIISLYYAVYDRWGELIYETNDQNASGWDGTYKGSKCNVGVYVWYAEATFLSGNKFKFQGNVTLVR
jgi:gliding motility-associated-like protein